MKDCYPTTHTHTHIYIYIYEWIMFERKFNQMRNRKIERQIRLTCFPTGLALTSCKNLSIWFSKLFFLYIYIYIYIYTWVMLRFCNILVTWGKVREHWMLLLMLWRWQTILDCQMPSLAWYYLSATHQICLYDWEHSIPEFVWSVNLLQPKQNFLNHLITSLRSTVPSPFAKDVLVYFWGLLS